jgi:hypothetical protein
MKARPSQEATTCRIKREPIPNVPEFRRVEVGARELPRVGHLDRRALADRGVFEVEEPRAPAVRVPAHVVRADVAVNHVGALEARQQLRVQARVRQTANECEGE